LLNQHSRSLFNLSSHELNPEPCLPAGRLCILHFELLQALLCNEISLLILARKTMKKNLILPGNMLAATRIILLLKLLSVKIGYPPLLV
jgi:hypothetical protein